MKVLIIVPKGFEIYEFSALFDVLAWADKDLGYDVETVTCGFQKQVTGAFGITLLVDTLISEVNPSDYDALAIPGGFGDYGYYEEAYNEDLLSIIREFHIKKKIIASVCTGALPLGKSGILAEKKATTYSQKDGYRQKELLQFGVNVVDTPVVVDGNIITSTCPGTAIDVAFKFLEMLTDSEKAENVKKAMGFC